MKPVRPQVNEHRENSVIFEKAFFSLTNTKI